MSITSSTTADAQALTKDATVGTNVAKTYSKKSILMTKNSIRGRERSKASIHWIESLREHKHSGESSLPGQRIVLDRGLRWKTITEVIHRVRDEHNPIQLEETNTADPKTMDYLAREMGVRKPRVKNVKLSADQEAKLKLMKEKVTIENELYLKNHPELDILLMLIYRMLFRIKPGGPNMYVGPLDFLKPHLGSSDPRIYVANYVHHLNQHRSELVMPEVEVPFDQPPDRIKDEEKWRITQFARVLVEKCAAVAAQGEAQFNVGAILDSVLLAVSPSVDTISGAREAVAEVLDEVLAGLDEVKRRETTQIVEDVLSAILHQLRPAMVPSQQYLDPLTSVENVVGSFMHTLIGRVGKQIRREEKEHKNIVSSTTIESDEILDEFMTLMPSKSILRRKPMPREAVEVPRDMVEDVKKKASKVRFGGIAEFPKLEGADKRD